MPLLTAIFTVPLAATLVLKGGHHRSYSTQVDGFEVVLRIPLDGDRRSRSKKEKLWTYFSQQIVVSVSRDEPLEPPALTTTLNGGQDFRARHAYFAQRKPEYERIAALVLANVISFFRFQLRQPIGAALVAVHGDLANPEWTDAQGVRIDSGGHTWVAKGVPGRWGELGVTKLERRHDGPLQSALANPRPPSLHEEILSDAQAAAFDGNVRRAVLELAIACEVFAKHTFFGGAAAAVQVFESLEDKGKVSVKVLDLIDVGGAALYGRSFRQVDPTAYTDIDHLFRARNKVAHRGAPVFKDDGGHLHTVDRKFLSRWWRSVGKLFDWAGTTGSRWR